MCFDATRLVKALPCQHVICLHCLHRICKDFGMKCPLCRNIICAHDGAVNTAALANCVTIAPNSGEHVGITLCNDVAGGCRVTRLEAGDLGSRALKKHAVITAINGFRVSHHETAVAIINSASLNGILMTFEVKRRPRLRYCVC